MPRTKVKKPRKRTTLSKAKFWKKLANTEPNNAELTLLGIITWLKLPYKYVGNAQFILHGKAPDFIHSGGEKKIIELFGERWHNANEESERIQFFAHAGWTTLIVWQKELMVRNRKNLYKRLREFDDLVI